MKQITVTLTTFPLGQIVITSNAQSILTASEIDEALRRHARGDWGNVCEDDALLNFQALESGDRLLSDYGTGPRRFWIITEADRSVTTILLPQDY